MSFTYEAKQDGIILAVGDFDSCFDAAKQASKGGKVALLNVKVRELPWRISCVFVNGRKRQPEAI